MKWLWLVAIGVVLAGVLFAYNAVNMGRKIARMARTGVVDETGRSYVLSEMQWDNGTLVADTFFQELPTDRGDLKVSGGYLWDPVHVDDAHSFNAEKVDILVRRDNRASEYKLRFPDYKGKGGESLRLMIDWQPVDDPKTSGSSGCDVQVPPKPAG